MIINRIDTNNNFGAKIVGRLAEKIAHKKEGNFAKHYSLGMDKDLHRKINEEKPAANRVTSSKSDSLFFINPMLPTEFSQEERERLKQFEADVLQRKQNLLKKK